MRVIIVSFYLEKTEFQKKCGRIFILEEMTSVLNVSRSVLRKAKRRLFNQENEKIGWWKDGEELRREMDGQESRMAAEEMGRVRSQKQKKEGACAVRKSLQIGLRKVVRE